MTWVKLLPSYYQLPFQHSRLVRFEKVRKTVSLLHEFNLKEKKSEKRSPAHWPGSGGDWLAVAVLVQGSVAVGFSPAVCSCQQRGRQRPGYKLRRCRRGGWKACLSNLIQKRQKTHSDASCTRTHNAASYKRKHLNSAPRDSEDTPKHGSWEERWRELTTLAAFEVQFAAQKCTTGLWWIFTDFSHLFSAFWSACFWSDF